MADNHRVIPGMRADSASATGLKHRHFKALLWPQIYPIAAPSDPAGVALVRVAEESRQIEAARDIEIRYWRARGVDIEARKTTEKMTAASERGVRRGRDVNSHRPKDAG